MKDIKIIITGSGGDGIKSMSIVLANILSKFYKKVSVYNSYDAASRGGRSEAFISIGDSVTSPFFDSGDILLEFSKSKNCHAPEKYSDSDYGFKKIAKEKFGKEIMANMIALGFLLKKLKIDIKQIDFGKILPSKLKELGECAVSIGYDLQK